MPVQVQVLSPAPREAALERRRLACFWRCATLGSAHDAPPRAFGRAERRRRGDACVARHDEDRERRRRDDIPAWGEAPGTPRSPRPGLKARPIGGLDRAFGPRRVWTGYLGRWPRLVWDR